MTGTPSEDVTQILSRIQSGRGSAAELLPVMYEELRAIAKRALTSERGAMMLQPTMLVNEVYVRLVSGDARLGERRNEFLAVAARAMRNVIVDHAREQRAEKRGGSRDRVTLSGLPVEAVESTSQHDLPALRDALLELERLDSRAAEIVAMHFFSGMTGSEIAQTLGVHRNTVVRELAFAKAWLRRALEGGNPTT